MPKKKGFLRRKAVPLSVAGGLIAFGASGLGPDKKVTYEFSAGCEEQNSQFRLTNVRGISATGPDSPDKRGSVTGTCESTIDGSQTSPVFGDQSVADGILKVTIYRGGNMFHRPDPDVSVQPTGFPGDGSQEPTEASLEFSRLQTIRDAEYQPYP